MKRLIALLIMLVFSTSAFADPIFLKKGETYTATEDSVVFTAKEEQKIRLRLMDADYMDKVISIQSNTIASLNTQLGFQQQISDKYRKAWLESDEQLTKTLQSATRYRFLYLLVGVGLTVGAGVAMGQASK